ILPQQVGELMGAAGAPLALRAQPPAVVLPAGLQGAGKTTTAAKLARRLIERDRKRVLLVSTDVRRPAAMLQLERLAGQVHAEYFAPEAGAAPAAIAAAAPRGGEKGGVGVGVGGPRPGPPAGVAPLGGGGRGVAA